MRGKEQESKNRRLGKPKWLPKSIPKASFSHPAAPWPGKQQPVGPQGKEKKATTGPLSLPGCAEVGSRRPEGGPEGAGGGGNL